MIIKPPIHTDIEDFGFVPIQIYLCQIDAIIAG